MSELVRRRDWALRRVARASDVKALRDRAKELRATWPADRETDYVVGFQDAANYLEALPIE